jgi:hypothetical protein
MFDFKKAFDKVWHKGLICKMHQKKIPSISPTGSITLIENFMFKLKIQNQKYTQLKLVCHKGAFSLQSFFNLFFRCQ